jgi:hypothetical protein
MAPPDHREARASLNKMVGEAVSRKAWRVRTFQTTLTGSSQVLPQSRDIAKQSLTNQLEEVEGKFWILKIKRSRLGMADYQHFSALNASVCEGAPAIRVNQSKFADYPTGQDCSFDFH